MAGARRGASLPGVDGLDTLVSAFRTVRGASLSADELKDAIASAKALPRSAPTPLAIAELDRLSAEIPDLLRDLVGDQPEVRAFAEQLGRGGAPISALTPEVLKWMDERGFGLSFKIVAGAPAGQNP